MPPPPRGHVRDIRLRWALAEADLPHAVATVPYTDRILRPAFTKAHRDQLAHFAAADAARAEG